MKQEKKKFVLAVVPTMESAYHNLRDFVAIFIPIGITTIAALLEKAGYEVQIVDGEAEGLSLDETIRRVALENPAYVGSTSMTATMDATEKFYAGLKKCLPDVLTIVGGPHVSALPGRTLKESRDIDIVVKGEGDDTIIELMNAIEERRDLSGVKGIAFRGQNGIVETPSRELIRDLGRLPMPAYHLVKYDSYYSYMWNNWVGGNRRPLGIVFTGRGCYGKCNFCAAHLVSGHGIRYFPAERIKREIDHLVDVYKIRILYFQDDTFTANRKLVNEICDHIIEKGYNKYLEINVSSRVDSVYPPTLAKMRKAGIRWIFFGVESGNQKILDRMNKRITIRQIEDAFEKANRAGMHVGGNFMIGHIGETYETVMDTIRFACKLKQDFTSFTIATPLPGTELYQYCLDNGIDLPSWEGFGTVTTRPIVLNKNLNAEELVKLRKIANDRFFKRPAYIFRILTRFYAPAVIRDFTKMYFALRKETKAKRF